AFAMQVSAQKRQAIKAFLRTLVNASLAATRAVEAYMTEAAGAEPGTVARAEIAGRRNTICTEFLTFHMWQAGMRGRKKMLPEAYQAFVDHAVRGLSVTAAGVFTGLIGTKSEQEFEARLHEAFSRYGKCSAMVGEGKDPLTSNDPLSAVSRRIAEL